MRLQRKIPLHGTQDTMERLSLHADMASLNPDGFRTSSDKKNRKRVRGGKEHQRKTNAPGRPRFKTRAEQLADDAEVE